MTFWHLRPAAPEDAETLAVLARDTFRETFTHYPEEDREAHLAEHYTPAIFTGYITDPDTRLWLAEAEGKPVSYVKFGAYKLPFVPTEIPVIELHRIYVFSAWKGYKIGAALMDKLWEYAGERQAKAVYLGVWEHNVKAQYFYRRYGFEKVGEYDYPPVGRTLDREWIMRKILE